VADKTSTLAAQKLAESGLTAADARKLGIAVLKPAQTKQLFDRHDRSGLKFVYHDPTTGAERTDVYRVRLLGPEPAGAFGEKSEKPLRYLQPADSPPAAYFPSIIDWRAVFADADRTVLITEGELKAACAAKLGFACIGLGGVDSWRSTRRGWDLLPELAAVLWRKRPVVIIFDSDGATKPGVELAQARLVEVLAQRGALPLVARLPDLPDRAKTGLDDFLVARGRQALEDLIASADDDELAAALWRFNARFTFVMNPGVIYDEEQLTLYEPSKFQTALFANVKAVKFLEGKAKTVPVAEEWVRWAARRELAGLTYRPGEPLVSDRLLNEWRGWGCVEKAGSVKLWTALLDHLFVGAEPEARRWFEEWCLWPIAHPGAKLRTACGLWSNKQGIGKSLVGFALGRVYGDNYSLISQRELESDFNGWAAKKQFVLVDDVSAQDSRAKADVLKKLITQEAMLVNVKFLPTYQTPDCVNYYLTSNRPNAFYLEEQDRRFFIHEVLSQPKPLEWYKTFGKWLDGEGPSALLAYARKFKFTVFDPFAAPPLTAAKQDMTACVRTELDTWFSELREAPDKRLRLQGLEYKRDLFTAAELFRMFDAVRVGSPVPLSAVGTTLRSVLQQTPGGPVKLDGEPSERFYVVRNSERWQRAAPAAIAKHVLDGRERERGSKKGKRY